MPTRAPITQRTIAEEIGVSVTTVARALGGGERISEDMIRKVRDTANRLGYVPNLDGRKLRTGQTFVIMTFLSFADEEEVGDSGSIGLLNGIHARLSQSDYAVRAVPVTMQEDGLDKIKEVVQGRNADGIILDHTTPKDGRVAFLQKENIPFVTFGQTSFTEQHAFFDLDNAHSAYIETKALIDQGFRKIALLDADQRFSFVDQRLSGYRRALQEASLPFDPLLIRNGEPEAKQARQFGSDLVRAGADAIVCVNELAFLGARAGVRQYLGKRAGAIGYSMRSGTNIATYVQSHTNVSFYSRQDAGWNLADLLLRRIAGAQADNCQLVCKTSLRPFKDEDW